MVCEHCLQQFPAAGTGEVITECVKNSLQSDIGFDNAFSLWAFDENVQNLIHYFKYSEYWRLAKPIARFMSVKLRQLNFSPANSLLIPVPLHKTRQRERGYNQSEMICRFIREKTAIPFDNSILQRIRYTQTQTELGPKERVKNVSGAFCVRSSEPLSGKTIILIDDVLTTGATMNACAKELRKLAPEAIYVFTVAKA
ncbi:MAG: ComF family protein [Calditrichaeota bacterium]|nr:ComF family protein [Calditrichota bacterium]